MFYYFWVKKDPQLMITQISESMEIESNNPQFEETVKNIESTPGKIFTIPVEESLIFACVDYDLLDHFYGGFRTGVSLFADWENYSKSLIEGLEKRDLND